MIKAYIKINDFDDILRLNKISNTCDYKLSIYSGTKIFNPKSLIMLFELKVGSVFPMVAPVSEYREKEKFLDKFGNLVVSYNFY